MNRSQFKSRPFLVSSALLLVSLPVAVLLPGCGNGNGDYGVGTFSSVATLSPSQLALLTINTGGGGANGFLNVGSPIVVPALGKQTRAFNFFVPRGNYAFTGAFSPPSDFSVAGRFPGNVRFTIVGQVPANGGTGNYILRANGQTVTGTLQSGSLTPTSAPTTASTPTP